MSNHKEILPAVRKYRILVVPLIVIIIVGWIWCWWWPYNVTTVYIARHAEKLNATPDTPLSTAGLYRATELAHVLKDEGINAVFVTEFQRTQQTGEPSALQAGISMTQYSAGTAQNLVDTILQDHAGDRVLVIAHSNTVDDIAAELGVTGVPELSENQFDRLFVVHRFASKAHLDRLRYGEQTP